MSDRALLQRALDALKLSHTQNACDMYLTGEELRQVECSIAELRAALAAPVAPAVRKPVAWIRYCSDGTYEGPVIHGRMEEVRKESGAWTPLYEAPVAPALVPLSDEQWAKIAAITGCESIEQRGRQAILRVINGIKP